VPDRTYRYYLELAGGIDPERSANGKVTIVDSAGKKLKRDAVIKPGDRIFVKSNDFTYNFNRYFPVITAGVGLVTTILTLINLLAN